MAQKSIEQHHPGTDKAGHSRSDCSVHTCGQVPKAKPRVVIEVKGGMVQEIYTDLNDVDFVLVDWDNINEGDEAEEYVAIGLKRMPEETREQVENALA